MKPLDLGRLRAWSAVPAPVFVGGNQIDLLEGGDALFPRMRQAISEARQEVWLATYIFHDDPASQAIARVLMEAAERVPNLQFLVNATKAIFTLLEIKGWDPVLAKRGLRFLQLAQARDMRNARVISARELYQRVARKYGIAIIPLATAKRLGEKTET